jgi:hypothetical protein
MALPAGGRDERTPFARTNLKPQKLPENAQTPTSRVHALLACALFWKQTLHNQTIKPSVALFCARISYLPQKYRDYPNPR